MVTMFKLLVLVIIQGWREGVPKYGTNKNLHIYYYMVSDSNKAQQLQDNQECISARSSFFLERHSSTHPFTYPFGRQLESTTCSRVVNNSYFPNSRSSSSTFIRGVHHATVEEEISEYPISYWSPCLIFIRYVKSRY